MKKGFALILLFIPISLIFIIISTLLVFKNKKVEITKVNNSPTVAEKQWKGLILTKEGFIKINSEGVFERKDLNSKPTIFPIPNVNKDFSAYNPYSLRKDGNIITVGDSQLSPNFQRNRIYAWKINSQASFQPIFSVPEGQKISSYVFSPDNKKIAISTFTRSESEMYEGVDTSKMSKEEINKILTERENIFQDELRTISLYEVKSGKLIITLKLELLESPSRRISNPKLEWKGSKLFAEDTYKIYVIDPVTGNIVTTLENDNSITGPLQPNQVIISPDGTKYYNSKTFGVKTILDNNILAKFKPTELIDQDQTGNGDEAISVGPASFSFDSDKVIQATQSIRGFDFIIWELDLRTGLTKKIARLNNVNYGLRPEDQKTLWLSYNFQFIGYTPSAAKIFFNIFAENNERTGARLDYFTIKPGDLTTDYHESFWEVSSWTDLEKVSGFMGWYKSD